MDYEQDLKNLSEREERVLGLPPKERARHFAHRYYRFYFHGRTGKQAEVADIETAIEKLAEWFENNPKRLVPDPQVMFELAPIGKPSVLHNALYGFYVNALDRDYKQVAWRK